MHRVLGVGGFCLHSGALEEVEVKSLLVGSATNGMKKDCGYPRLPMLLGATDSVSL